MRFALLALLLALTSCSRTPSPNVVLDPALISHVPSDAIVVGSLRIEHMRKTPFWDKYVVNQNAPGFDEIRKRTGIDPRRDVWEVMLAYDGKSTVALARGKFSEMGMEPRIEMEGAKRTPYKGYTLIGNDEVSLSFLNSSTAVGGPTALVKRIIDNRNSGGGMPKWLQDRARALPSANQAWVVGTLAGRLPDIASKGMGNFGNIAQFLNSIQVFSAYVDASNGVKGEFDATSSDADNARRLKDALRGAIGFARLNTPSDKPQLLRLFDGIDTQQNEKRVTTKIDVPMDLVDELIRMGQSMQRVGPPMR
jgi:hypothetical protein